MIQHGFNSDLSGPRAALLASAALIVGLPQLATAQVVAEPVPAAAPIDAPIAAPVSSDTANARTTTCPAAFFTAFAPDRAVHLNARHAPGSFRLKQTNRGGAKAG